MFFDTDHTVRDVFTDLHARSIVACGGLKESIQDLKRDVMMAVYEVKDSREVTDEVLADLLGISDRWLRMLGDTKPPPKPISDGRRILLLVQLHADWISLDELMDALREAGEFTSPRRIQRLLTGLLELGQVECNGRGRERSYRATAQTTVHVAKKKERSKEARSRLSSLLSTVYEYVNNAPGALCSRYQYRIRTDRTETVANKMREALSKILREEEALCEGLSPNDTVEYTTLLNSSKGLSGAPGSATPEGREEQ